MKRDLLGKRDGYLKSGMEEREADRKALDDYARELHSRLNDFKSEVGLPPEEYSGDVADKQAAEINSRYDEQLKNIKTTTNATTKSEGTQQEGGQQTGQPQYSRTGASREEEKNSRADRGNSGEDSQRKVAFESEVKNILSPKSKTNGQSINAQSAPSNEGEEGVRVKEDDQRSQGRRPDQENEKVETPEGAASKGEAPPSLPDAGIAFAPYRSTQVSSLQQDAGIRDSPEYRLHQEVLNSAAKALGIPITSRSETWGGYVDSETGKPVTEVSSVIHVQATPEQAELLAAVLGKAAPEMQDSVLVGSHDENGSGSEYTIHTGSFENAQKALESLKANGLQYFTIDKNSGDIIILDSDNGIKDNILKFTQDLQKQGIYNGTETSSVNANFVGQNDYDRILEKGGLQARTETGGDLNAIIEGAKKGYEEIKAHPLIGTDAEGIFAGGKIKGKITADLGNRVKINDGQNTYTLRKSDLLKDGETIPEHYAKIRQTDEIKFNRKVDEEAAKWMQRLTPEHLRGVSQAGLGADQVIRAAADIVKDAYRLGEDMVQAIERAVKYLKENWEGGWGETPEEEVRTSLGGLVRDQKIQSVIGRYRGSFSDDQIRSSLKDMGLDDAKVKELMDNAPAPSPAEGDYIKPIQQLRAAANRNPEFTGDPEIDRKTISGSRNAMVLQAKKLINNLPAKFNDPVLQEHVYHNIENPDEPLTADEKEFRDKYVLPIKDALTTVYKRVIGQNPDLAEPLAEILGSQVGYVPREVVGKGGTLERIKQKAEGVNTAKGQPKLLESSGHLRGRVFKSYEDGNGNRQLVVVKGNDVSRIGDDGNLVDVGTFDGKKTFTDPDGNKYELGDATVKEIESGSATKYYKTPLANFINAYIEMKQVDMAGAFMEKLKETLGPDQMIDLKKTNFIMPKGYSTTELANFRGYAFPNKVAASLNRLSYANRNDPLRVLTGANALLRNYIVFGTGIPHWFNEIDGWLREGGISRFANPYRLGKTAMKAAYDLTNQTADYYKLMENGASLMSQDTKNYTQFMLDATLQNLKQRPGILNRLAKTFGYEKPSKMLNALTDLSHKSAMWSHDLLMMQAVYEQMDKGKTMRDAIDYVNKYIPDYDIPSTVMGSEAVSKSLRNPNLFMFAPYHWSLFKAFYNMGKDAVDAAKTGNVKEGLEVMDKVAMQALLTAIVYPAMQGAFAKIFTTDADREKGKKAGFRIPGASKIVEDISQFERGQEQASDFLYKYMTPAQATSLPIELILNRKLNPFEFGQHIYLPSDLRNHPGQAAKDIKDYSETKFNPYQKYADVAAGKKTLKDVAEEQINVNRARDIGDAQKTLKAIQFEFNEVKARAIKKYKEGDPVGAQKILERYQDDLNKAQETVDRKNEQNQKENK